jgi:hypothetical protein
MRCGNQMMGGPANAAVIEMSAGRTKLFEQFVDFSKMSIQSKTSSSRIDDQSMGLE